MAHHQIGDSLAAGDAARELGAWGFPEGGMGSVTRALRAVYRHDLPLEAFAIVAQTNDAARLVIAGEGDERPRLEALASSLGVAGADRPVRVLGAGGLRRSRAGILAGHIPGEDLARFGYGSLIWNPAFHFARREVATIYGHHRRFCLWTSLGRACGCHCWAFRACHGRGPWLGSIPRSQ